MPRTIAILALLQSLLIILGFFTLGIVLKMSGYPAPGETYGIRWNPFAVFLREHGMWLLLLPALWFLFASFAQQLDRGLFSYRTACVVGVCLCGIVIAVFLYAATFSYTRPLFMHVN